MLNYSYSVYAGYTWMVCEPGGRFDCVSREGIQVGYAVCQMVMTCMSEVVLGLLADVCVIGHWHRSIVIKVIKTSVWLLFGYVPPA